ncbi:MAG: ROK family protein [Elusimicrobiota bacterium]
MDNRVIAVDIGGTGSTVAVIDDGFNIIDKIKFDTSRNYNEVLENIENAVNKFDPEKKLKIGIAICGLLSHDGETLLVAPNLGWKRINMRESFGRLARKFIVVNDGTAAGWVSYLTETPENINRVLSVTLGTGVGGGIVVNGELLIGAGELGHLKIDPDGPVCGCGRKGCIEAFVGGRNIPKNVKEWFGLEVDSPKALFLLAEKGDKKAIECWNKIGYLLGYALSGVVNLNGIEVITIGGKISRASKYYMKEVEKTLKENLVIPEFQKCDIVISKWENNVSLMGAAAVVIKPPKNLLSR